MTAARDCDIAIVGGGPVGAMLGALLVRGSHTAGLRVVLLERELPNEHARGGADLRVVALSRASERICRAAGAWSALSAAPDVLSPYERMHVWPASEPAHGTGALTFDAGELAEPNLGYIVGNTALQSAALEALRAGGGELRATRVDDLVFEADAVRIETGDGALRAALVIGADGGRSVVRRAAGLGTLQQDYGQLGIVANVACERAHARTAWQRFLGEGTLALLPLASGECSIVWSLPKARAEALLALEPAAFSAELTAASDGVLGALTLASERRAFPLRRVHAPVYVRERCALVGDAAHIVHPLAGQGVNLGLLDAAALVDCIDAAVASGEAPGALRVLRRYERWRKGENEAMGLAMDLFNRYLAFGDDALGRIAQRGLGWVGRAPWLRRAFVERALGIAGEMPAAVSRSGRSSLRR
ncbi:MAG: hypothetical protein RL603_1606 [Pseudomonadota bacterium]|jgi:2-octaprenylphenol hydroxylase